MSTTRRTFAHLDTDSDPSQKDGSAFDSAVNIALEPGYVTPQGGNVLVPYALPAGVSRRLGGFEDGSTGTAVTLLFNSLGNHRLIRYDPLANAGAGGETTLLEWSGLRLSADLEPQGGILDGLLAFLDANGEVRSVNLARAAAGGYTAALLLNNPYALHAVKPPPALPPAPTRETNADTADPRSVGNNVKSVAWQFAFQYEYPDHEPTPLGPYSLVVSALNAFYGADTDTRNFIRVPYPVGPLGPPSDVRTVRLLVRTQNEITWLVAGKMTPGLPFDFYGSTTGEALTVAQASKLAEAIPIRIGTLAVVNSRLMGGDCTEGYAPALPAGAFVAESAAVLAGPDEGLPVQVYIDTAEYQRQYTDENGNAVTDSVTVVHYYRVEAGVFPNAASTYRELRPEGTGLYSLYPGNVVLTYAQAFTQTAIGTTLLSRAQTSELANLVGGPSGQDRARFTLHDRCVYPAGIAYFDAVGRTAGAEGVVAVRVARQNYLIPVPQNLRWSLAVGVPPPSWAVSYAVLLGRNRTIGFFLQYKAADVLEYRGDGAGGAPTLVAVGTAAQNNTTALWVPTTALLATGRGYVFEAGDRLRFPGRTDGNTDYPILYARGGYVAISHLAKSLFSDPATRGPVVELYRPASALATEVLYERGERYAVLAPGTSAAAHTVLSGVLAGDAALLPAVSLNEPAIEAMNPTAAAYDLWLSASRGRPVPLNPEGRNVRRKSLLRFSGVKVQGTQLNGLGQWDALSQYEELAQEQGGITRLTVADQTQTDGSILLVNQERGATSLSLGRSQIQTADGEPLLAITKAVIGGSNALRGGFGCTHPASVVLYAGKVYFWCQHRAELLRYDRNGLTPLGLTYKARTLLETLARQYAGGVVRGAFDPQRKEYRLTFAAVGLLPARTLVFSERREAWAGDSTGHGEAGMGVGNELVLFNAGNLWRHTHNAPLCSFFGVSTPAQLTFTVAQGAGVAKRFLDVSIESPSLWLPTRLQTDTALTSRTFGAWFTQREGVWRAGLRRAVPGAGVATVFSLHNGLPLIGTRLAVTLVAPVGAKPLTAASVSHTPRSGQGMGG